MISNFNLMANARRTLAGKWKKTAWVAFVYLLIYMLIEITPAINLLILVLAGPLTFGYTRFFLKILRGQEAVLNEIFSGFKDFERTLKVSLLMALFVFLWTLLLVIPGIVALFKYSMVFFLMADDPNMTPTEAINKSVEMMRGNKGKLFCLGFRFIGWILLSIITLGIGFIFLCPYWQTTLSLFYEDLMDSSTGTTEESAS